MEQLDAAHDELLDKDDKLVGRVKDVKKVERRLRHRLLQPVPDPDLINRKGKPLVTTARLEAVWKRLSSRFITVVADTSMITLSTEYLVHFHDIYIDGKENAKMTVADAHATLHG